ncbi:MAG: hypothetical protein JST48_03630 [Bacteroidetes bacterium]|nr:hypothetical protein [Bacteroidota bacterium]
MINKFYAASALLFFGTLSFAQTVTVKTQNEKIKNESMGGYATELEGKLAEVGLQWGKFLKEWGRVKLFSSEPVVVTEPNFNGTVYPNGIVYAYTFESGTQTRVWLGINPTEWNEKDVAAANKQLEKLVYQFGIKYYQNKVQGQINETQEAADAVEKQKQKLVNQNKDLTLQLTNNEQEKIRLEKSTMLNKLEHEVLNVKLEKNKKAQDSLTNAAVQIKKVKETHLERLRKIN